MNFIEICCYPALVQSPFDLFKWFTAILGFTGFGIALLQYLSARKWKKAEFVALLIKDFEANPSVQRSKLMLDWNIVDIVIGKDEQQLTGQVNKVGEFYIMRFNDDLLFSALRIHIINGHPTEKFCDDETIIRLSLDDFLDRLGRFNTHIENGLITFNEVKSYLDYWIRIWADEKSTVKSKELLNQFKKYIIYYNFIDVIKLADRFGYKISEG
jgi:hypothetical protein